MPRKKRQTTDNNEEKEKQLPHLSPGETGREMLRDMRLGNAVLKTAIREAGTAKSFSELAKLLHVQCLRCNLILDIFRYAAEQKQLLAEAVQLTSGVQTGDKGNQASCIVLPRVHELSSTVQETYSTPIGAPDPTNPATPDQSSEVEPAA